MARELDIDINYRKQFCQGIGDCPLKQAYKKLESATTLDRARRGSKKAGLVDQTGIVTQGLPPEVRQEVFVSACTQRLPKRTPYTDCGSMFIHQRPKHPEYTDDPSPDEDPLMTQARIFTWSLFQLTPEQRKSAIGSDAPLLASTESWQRAMIKLETREKSALIGLDLDHPGMAWEEFEWNQLSVAPRVAEDQENLALKITNHKNSDRIIKVTLQNLYRDEEDETTALTRIEASSQLQADHPIPPLLEDAPSVYMSLNEYEK